MTVKKLLIYIALLLGIGILATWYAGMANAQTATPIPVTQNVVPTLPPPTTLQTIQFACAAPVGGTVIPIGLPIDGIMLVCVQRVVNIPIAPCPGLPADKQTTPCVITPAAPASIWSIVASANDTVLIKAGTTVRWGAPAGTPPGDQYVTVPLAVDSYNPPITFAIDTTLIVGKTALLFSVDPANNYVKHLEMLGNTGGVVVNPQ